jgi:NADPH-dependent 2,4-dienoyl-CoA reductase/sulfur reductase-like enzyme/nitrite reductase/ring-hydroxylating ferredoxin subunit
MGHEQDELTGPDLCAGVSLDALVEGQPLLGHAGDDAVLMIRRGEDVFAIGATCTHYGAPLAEGIVTGDVIRCPWHHACFSLRSGEAVAAPALNPLPSWRTEIRDGRVFVGRKQESDALAFHGRVAAGPSSVVIVGAGAAGSAAAETLRREGYAGPVVLIDPDADAPYDRPNLSKDYLAGIAPEEWIPLRPQGFHAGHGIERVVAAVTAIDTEARTVLLSNGRTLAFGALLMATGAAAIRLPLPGADQPHVHVLRSLADCRALIRSAETARRVVIAGASFIGLEAAASLRARGLEVSVVAPEAVPFARSLGAELGARFRSLHEQHGVAFHLGRTLSAIRENSVVLDDGTVLDADVVLLGVGVRPVLELARQAGLAGDQGVQVNAFLETTMQGVYAAGDIALFPDAYTRELIRVEHWVVAQRQGQTAARNMLGRRERFEAVPFFWTQQYDLQLAYVGHATAWERVDIEGDLQGTDCSIRFIDNDRVAAVATIGRDRESLTAEIELERNAATGGMRAQSRGPAPGSAMNGAEGHHGR